MTDKEAFCYVGKQPGCGCMGLVVVDDPNHAKDTAKSVSDAVKKGLVIERMTVEEFKNSNSSFGCERDLKMKVCRESGLNKRPEAA